MLRVPRNDFFVLISPKIVRCRLLKQYNLTTKANAYPHKKSTKAKIFNPYRTRKTKHKSSSRHTVKKPAVNIKLSSIIPRQVFCWGSGIFGTRGDGSYASAREPVELKILEASSAYQVVCGWSDSLLLTDNHSLFRWGWAHDYRTTVNAHLMLRRAPRILRALQSSGLGTLGFQSAETKPILQGNFFGDCKQVKHVSSGSSWNVAVMTDGRMYTWGDGAYGQLGQNAATFLRHPTLVSEFGCDVDNPHFVETACGSTHTLALDDEGETYSFGRLDCFAVGLGNVDEFFEGIMSIGTTPQRLHTWFHRLDRTGEDTMGLVAKISAGRNISAFLTRDGELWTCGKNGGGALGTGDFKHREFPTKINAFDGEKVIDVSCGHYHMLAVTESHRVFSWGIGRHGQCARPPRAGIANPDAVSNRISMTSRTSDQLLSFHPQDLSSIIPPEARVTHVVAGVHHSAFITDRSECIVCGGDEEDRDAYLPKLPFGSLRVHSISFGISHGIAVTSARMQDGFQQDEIEHQRPSLQSIMNISDNSSFEYLSRS